MRFTATDSRGKQSQFGSIGSDRMPPLRTTLRAPAASESHLEVPSDQAQSKLGYLRRKLLTNLPSQRVIDALLGASSGWWLLRRLSLQDPKDSLGSLPVESLSRSHPTAIASALLCIAISIQQLPPNFDIRSLQLATSVSTLMHQYVTIVSTLITSDDDMLSSIEGLECLVLQGVYHNNAGKLRSAWLCYRRSLSIAQLIGLHRDSSQYSQNPDLITIQRIKGIWRHIVQADRYLALTLGLPYGVVDSVRDLDSPNIPDQELGTENVYMGKLAIIAGHIIDRNQSSPHVTDAMVSSTQTIDAELRALSTKMAPDWWDLPSHIPFGKSRESVTCYARLMAQLWHYQLEATVHLPLMLYTATEDSYGYSRHSCLKASRKMIKCYLALRQITNGSFCCKSLDFQAFTAAVTLLLNLLGPSQNGNDQRDGFKGRELRNEDWKAVDSVTETLEYLTSAQSDQVATQALRVLRVLRGTDLNEEGGKGSMRLVIPYFGTVSVQKREATTSAATVGYTEKPNAPRRHVDMEEPINFGSEASSGRPYQPEVPQHLSVHAHVGNFFPSSPTQEQLPEDWLSEAVQYFPPQTTFASDLDADWGFWTVGIE